VDQEKEAILMDLTESIVPRSDQLNADDLMSGPRTVTITKVTAGNAEQPVDVHLAEFPRVFKPSKSMRRVMVLAWGSDSAAYIGKRLTIYRDPSIRFGKEVTGGIRISHMSGIPKRMNVALTVTRGKREPFVVDVLPDNVPASKPISEEAVARIAELRAEYRSADAERKEAIKAEVKALEADQ
jgi:hypothetical protein